jgi:hypothetical protein
LIGYIEQARLAMSGNGASGSFGTGPASGYILNFMFMFIVFVTSTLDHALIFIYRNVMIYALFFGIKMNRNWPLISTGSAAVGQRRRATYRVRRRAWQTINVPADI